MKPNMSQIMKQAQKLQASMEQAQKEIAQLEVVGEAGGGLVKVTMKGNHQIPTGGVKLEAALKEEEQEVVEDLIAAAFNDAVRKVEARTKEKMSSLSSGLGLPGGLGDLL